MGFLDLNLARLQVSIRGGGSLKDISGTEEIKYPSSNFQVNSSTFLLYFCSQQSSKLPNSNFEATPFVCQQFLQSHVRFTILNCLNLS